MKKMLVILFMFISMSAFADGVFGHWDDENGYSYSFYQDYTFVIMDDEGEMFMIGEWEYTKHGITMSEYDFGIKFVNGDKFYMGEPDSDVVITLIRQKGTK